MLTNAKTSATISLVDKTCGSGGMADAHGSGPCAGNSVRVQVPFSALIERPEMKISGLFLLSDRAR